MDRDLPSIYLDKVPVAPLPSRHSGTKPPPQAPERVQLEGGGGEESVWTSQCRDASLGILPARIASRTN